MTYKLGTRVKQVRSRIPANIGNTGIVVNNGKPVAQGHDFKVKVDQTAYGNYPSDLEIRQFPAGTVFDANKENWEPIIPEGHKPCEETFSIDDLIKGFKHEQLSTKTN